MTKLLASLSLLFLVVACASKKDFKADSADFQVQENLGITGSVSFTFQQYTLYRNISIGAPQANRCRDIATEYAESRGISVDLESIKLTQEETSRRCARKDILGACDTHQYVQTFTCQAAVI